MSLDWINPRALVALAAVAGPVIVHLLRRQRATRLPFPSLRFVAATQAAAVRLRLPADRRLMLLRMAIMAVAAAAWAQPVLITSARGAAERQALARAIVRDESPSMASVIVRAREATAAERQGATVAVEIASADIRAALRRAVAQLDAIPAGRREVVVVSDFQHGALSSRDIAGVPAAIGVRFIAIESPSVDGKIPAALMTFATDPAVAVAEHVELNGPRTRVAVGPGREMSLPRIIAPPAESQAVERLLRSVARAGAAAVSTERPVAAVFEGGPAPDVAAPRADWMLRAILRLRDDLSLRRAAADHDGLGRVEWSQPWITVAVNRSGAPVVAVGAHDRALVARVDAAPSELFAAVTLRALLNGVADPPSWTEFEPERIPAAQLKKWTRPAIAGGLGGNREPPGDSRGLWALVLVLLAIEQISRRAHRDGRTEERAAHAA